jgi:hypothetical protein
MRAFRTIESDPIGGEKGRDWKGKGNGGEGGQKRREGKRISQIVHVRGRTVCLAYVRGMHRL